MIETVLSLPLPTKDGENSLMRFFRSDSSYTNLLELWVVQYSLKSILERFSSKPTSVQIKLLQKAIEVVNRF